MTSTQLQHRNIAIAFYGITRSLKYTVESIRKQILEPARQVGSVQVYCHFFKQYSINNPRTGEIGELDVDEWQLLQPDVAQIEEVDTETENRYLVDLLPYGNAWEDDGQSLRNILRQLISLERVTQMIHQAGAADIVVFLRADMLYHDKFPFADWVSMVQHNTVMVPYWQWSGGLNDRFAVCGASAFVRYGSRIKNAERYCASMNKPLHSERLLMFTMMRSPLQLATMSMGATRVRSDGGHAKESFSRVKFAKRVDGFLRCNLYTRCIALRNYIATVFSG
ncbi:hypothetical protein [Rhodoferax saidenbachensis]|uniref:Uncharacterized protein n=1 Tax=Rhodoferax saidenbachensis TaxID=1484693 RepID=A0A1P8K9T7_9BURK|nr:hypothetical protein [Rhodoferax saidenbachensis]APW42761.1 hypothetical protein RS694_09620 [Rhodoferax saidenbachensis]